MLIDQELERLRTELMERDMLIIDLRAKLRDLESLTYVVNNPKLRMHIQSLQNDLRRLNK